MEKSNCTLLFPFILNVLFRRGELWELQREISRAATLTVRISFTLIIFCFFLSIKGSSFHNQQLCMKKYCSFVSRELRTPIIFIGKFAAKDFQPSSREW